LSKLLTFLLVQAFAIADSEADTKIEDFRMDSSGSSSSPVSFASHKTSSRIYCSGLCSTKPGCFGICWVNSAKDCRLFTVSAYFNRDSWTMLTTTTERCDIYASIVNSTIQQLPFTGCSQSGNSSGGVCSRAIDGDKRQNYFKGSCSHTDLTVPIWWEGQLPQQSMVASVTIYNRQDCCADRLNNFQLLVDGVVCYDMNIAIPFSVTNLSCWQLGSQVRILNRQFAALCICEIEAFGFFFSTDRSPKRP
uniref:FTP domain-containing protein n=1 Tax=Macrostomum lignano TaxID=282301 RepID=A0A1I8IT94_9PLAT